MKPKHLFILTAFLFTALQSFSQGAYTISGKIQDSTHTQTLAGAVIKIKGSPVAVTSKEDGSFEIKAFQKLPITLQVSYVGYKTQEFVVSDNNASKISISLYAQNQYAGQVIVSASRVSESILKSPVTIEKLDIRAIKESPSPTFFDALENLKGVQMTTLSIGYKVPNTRGFAGTTNSRFLQMVDGVDNISPGIGAPVANAVGPTELDIESVELIPGAASAVYGLNAINGISNMKTKNPFKYQGLSVYVKQGVNHVDGKDLPAALYQEYAIRYAHAFNDKFAFKINASYSQGTDWVANDTTDQYYTAGNKTNAALGVGKTNNPGADLINRYGDEYNSDLKTLTLQGKTYDVSRTGYYEKDLTDYSVKNSKVDVALFYKINPSLQVSYVYRIGTVSNNYQRGNRIRLNGEQIQQHAFELKGSRFFVKAYYTHENTGNNSFNFRPLAENIDMAFKKSPQWWNDYTTAYNSAYTTNGGNIAASHAAARASADNGRYLPGTAAFNAVRDKIIHTNNWDTVGAQLLLKSAFYHIEGQYDFSDLVPGIQLLAGGNYRKYIVTPDGNEYINPAFLTDPKQGDNDFYYYNFGGFVQATKQVFGDKLKITGSVRVDKTEYFDPKINPRIAFVYSPAEQHNFRLSYQNGYRFPTLFEGFAFVNNGGVRRLGGLRVTAGSLNVFENSYLNSSVTSFKNAVNADISNGINKNTSIANNSHLLVQSDYTYLQPEHLNSFEFGYKAVLFDNKVFLDADYYFNVYDNFIGQLDVTQPIRGTIGQTGGSNDSTAYFAYTGGTSVKKYKMWTNSKSKISNQGFDVGLNYNFFKKFNVGANISYANLVEVHASDAFTPAFNTPKWISNISFGNREVFKNTGFNLVWHWQDAFYWNSPLANGVVPAYSTIDAQVNYRLPEVSTTIKFGATNLLNTYHTQYIGGPSIGGFYYVTLVFDTNKL
ncbi:TonB-dependent receptor [Chitinophagaceae bacterium LWZ2-11]